MSPKLLFVVTEDWYFFSHRLPLAVAAQKAGFDVAVATRLGRQGEAIRAAGIRLIPFSLSRHHGNPVREVSALARLYRQERPDIVHHVALKPIVYGTLAAGLAVHDDQRHDAADPAYCPLDLGLAAQRTGQPDDRAEP